jgi:glucan biosynthesis protein C
MARLDRPPRLHFIDRVRVVLTILVIAHHAGQAYGPTGGSWPITNMETSRLLSPFFAVNAMFFMGMFFLISGYFVPMAYDRHGAATFAKSRFTRLGIPALFFGFLVFAPITYVSLGERLSLIEFAKFLYSRGYQELYVHLWFLLHLLLYSLVYVIWRLISDRLPKRQGITYRIPNHLTILIFIVLVACANWVIRIWYPLDTWKPLFFIIPAEVGHLPQYESMFIVGILAFHGDWFRQLPTRTGWIWLSIGVAAIAAFYIYDLTGGAILEPWLGPQRPYGLIAQGGKNWESLVMSLWEAVISTGMGIGLLVLFRQILSRPPNKTFAHLIDAQYGAFVIHILIVLGFQILLAEISLSAFTKFTIVTILGVSFSFGLAHEIRKFPGVNKIL